jgi:hypothetical protein
MRRPQKERSNDATRYQDDDRRRRPVESDEFSLDRGPEACGPGSGGPRLSMAAYRSS